MFSVQTYLLLPDDQRDRGNFPRQGQARHGWLPSLDEQSLVEIVEWPSGDGGHCRCTLEDVLKIVVMILVESTSCCGLLERCSSPLTKRYCALSCVSIPRPL